MWLTLLTVTIPRKFQHAGIILHIYLSTVVRSLSSPLPYLVQADVGLDGGVDAEGGAAVLVVDDAQSVTEIAVKPINLVKWPFIERK